MHKVVVAFVVGLTTGFGLSFLPFASHPSVLAQSIGTNTVGSVECVCDLQREVKVDDALRDERAANDVLRAEVERLTAELEDSAAREVSFNFEADGNWLETAWADLATDVDAPDRRQMLIDAGFPPARAEWVLSRESELQAAAVERHYQDPTVIEPMDYLAGRLAGRQALRMEIGNDEYERYLAATGQSTTVSITQVIPESPAQVAGFQVGDDIVDYDGTRVFNMIELMDKARDGPPGEAVVINIRRDGAPMQLVLPRGPLGVSGGKLLQ